MTDIVCYPSHNYEKTIRHFYNQETLQWHTDVHRNHGTIEENIKASDSDLSKESVMFEVFVEDELAAFFVYHRVPNVPPCLEGFHIGKKFREKEFIKSFWKRVFSMFAMDFVTGIWHGNTAAIEHLKRQGFEIDREFEYEGEKIVLLTVKLLPLCQ